MIPNLLNFKKYKLRFFLNILITFFYTQNLLSMNFLKIYRIKLNIMDLIIRNVLVNFY